MFDQSIQVRVHGQSFIFRATNDGIVIPRSLNVEHPHIVEAIRMARLKWEREYSDYCRAECEQLGVEYYGLPDVINFFPPMPSTLQSASYDLNPYNELQNRFGYVYLIRGNDGLFKIGRTGSPKSRLKSHRLEHGKQFKFIALIGTFRAVILERELHKKFVDKRIYGEWFALTKADIEYIKAYADESP